VRRLNDQHRPSSHGTRHPGHNAATQTFAQICEIMILHAPDARKDEISFRKRFEKSSLHNWSEVERASVLL
jgi:hypothetical protein